MFFMWTWWWMLALSLSYTKPIKSPPYDGPIGCHQRYVSEEDILPYCGPRHEKEVDDILRAKGLV